MSAFRFILFSLILTHQACTSGSAHREDVSFEELKQMPVTQVSTVISNRKTFEYIISTSGIVQSASQATVQSNKSGSIDRIFIKNGQHVVKGDLLFALDNSESKLSLEKAKVRLNAAEILFNDQMLGYGGIQDSTRIKIVKENLEVSSGLALARIEFNEAKLNMENSFIRASMTGVISGLDQRSKSIISTGQMLCYIHDPNKLIVNSSILESDVFKTKPNIACEISPLADLNQNFQATITEIDPRVNNKTGMVKVVLEITNASPQLFPGMNVSVKIKIPNNKSVVIPKEAIVVRSGKQVVFTLEDGFAKWNYVTCGQENGKEVEILQGLSEGKEVIIKNNLQLADNSQVKKVED